MVNNNTSSVLCSARYLEESQEEPKRWSEPKSRGPHPSIRQTRSGHEVRNTLRCFQCPS